MASVYFFITSKKNNATIYVRFSNGNHFDFKATTKLFVNHEHWNSKKQRVKQKADALMKDKINKRLSGLEQRILDTYLDSYMQGEFISPEWLRKVIAKFFNQPEATEDKTRVYFVPYFKKFVSEAIHVRKMKENTLKKYRTTLRRLQDFEQSKSKPLRFEDINNVFYKSFLLYLRSDCAYTDNTVGKYISTLKTVCKEAEKDELPIKTTYKYFEVPTEETKDTYLNLEEITRIFEYDFSDNERLDNARDLFIIGLHTGLRISDFLKLDITNIKEGYFEKETQKTGEFVVIPLHSQVKAVLNKRQWTFPRKITDPNFNKYIKEVCKCVGFTNQTEGSLKNPETNRIERGYFPKYKLVSSHICRRSFATNLYGELPNKTIMAVTGHRSERQFERYIKTTKKENAQQLAEYWKKHEKEYEQSIRKYQEHSKPRSTNTSPNHKTDY